MHDMQTDALDLFDKGFNIVPVLPSQKKVILPNWAQTTRNRAQVETWIKQYPKYGVGTITKDTPFIDIDITDSVISSKIYMMVLDLLTSSLDSSNVTSIATRTGKAPKLAIPCNLPYGFDPFKKSKSTIFLDEKGIVQAIEILCDGQMCLMKGIHPDTRQPYTWDVEEIPNLEDLPILTPRIIDELFSKFEELGNKKVASGKWTIKSQATANGTNLTPAQTKPRKPPKSIYSESQMQAILDDIPELNHDDWLKLGMGLHHQYKGTNIGERLWAYFSARFPTTFNAQEITTRYATLNKEPSSRGVTIGTVINYRNVALAKKEPAPIFELHDPTILVTNPTTLDPALLDPMSSALDPVTSVLDPSILDTSASSLDPSILDPSTSILDPNAITLDPNLLTSPIGPNSTINTSSNGKAPKWYSGWYFISSLNKLFNALTKELIKPDSFNFVFANELIAAGELKGTPTSYLSKLNLIPKLSGIGYLPGASRLYSENNQKYVNSYNKYITKGKVPTKYTEPKILVNYIKRMMHDKNERNILMDFMAHVVQKPGVRVNWAPILLGIQGTGKTTILEIMTVALGSINAKPVSADLFTNSFNSYAEGSMFVFVEEIKVSGDNRHRVLDKIKSIITNNIVNITNKGVDAHEIRNVTSYMLGTNHPDALPIDDEDRRYAVLQTILDLSEAEFADIYEFLEDVDNHWDIQQWLLRHPISPTFNARGRAPKTNATSLMIANTEDMLIAKIQEAIDKNTKLVNKSLISFTALKELVADDMAALQDKSLNHKIRNKLVQMHYTRAGNSKRTYTIGKSRHTLFTPDVNLTRTLKLSNDHFDIALERATK